MSNCFDFEIELKNLQTIHGWKVSSSNQTGTWPFTSTTPTIASTLRFADSVTDTSRKSCPFFPCPVSQTLWWCASVDYFCSPTPPASQLEHNSVFCFGFFLSPLRALIVIGLVVLVLVGCAPIEKFNIASRAKTNTFWRQKKNLPLYWDFISWLTTVDALIFILFAPIFGMLS